MSKNPPSNSPSVGHTVWDKIGLVALVILVAGVILLIIFWPPRTKQFAVDKNDAVELQASYSGMKLKFVKYAPFDETIDGATVSLNHCVFQPDPQPAGDPVIYNLPATYTQDASGTKQFPNESLSIAVDSQFSYTLVGGTFEWNGDHLQRCHFTATLTSGPRLMADFSAIARYWHFLSH